MTRTYFLSIVTTLCVVASQAQASISFAPHVDYPVGASSFPQAVCAADFDGDGALDLAVAKNNTANISILKNNGDGTFAAAVDYPTAGSGSSICSADFNGDGKPDLAVANDNNPGISVLINNGDGTFAAAVNYSDVTNNSEIYAYSIFAADFNGDGKPDLVIAHNLFTFVTVLLNNGDGTFASGVNYNVGANPESVFGADLDGDGKYDLAVANYNSNNISILKGNGDGTFASAINYPVPNKPSSVFAADLNGDGKPDLAVGCGGGPDDTIAVLLNNGIGGFTTPVKYYVHAGSLSVIVSDFDGDGKPDLASGTNININPVVLRNNGDGTFAAPLTFSAPFGTQGPCAADLNGDGKPDLVTANQYAANISVLINTSAGFVCGDANHDGMVNISDVVYLIAYIFSGGPAPNPLLSGDSNCDSIVNISDAVYLIAYIFSGGPAPCAACK